MLSANRGHFRIPAVTRPTELPCFNPTTSHGWIIFVTLIVQCENGTVEDRPALDWVRNWVWLLVNESEERYREYVMRFREGNTKRQPTWLSRMWDIRVPMVPNLLYIRRWLNRHEAFLWIYRVPETGIIISTIRIRAHKRLFDLWSYVIKYRIDMNYLNSLCFLSSPAWLG
jgi:hypothetical protein